MSFILSPPAAPTIPSPGAQTSLWAVFSVAGAPFAPAVGAWAEDGGATPTLSRTSDSGQTWISGGKIRLPMAGAWEVFAADLLIGGTGLFGVGLTGAPSSVKTATVAHMASAAPSYSGYGYLTATLGSIWSPYFYPIGTGGTLFYSPLFFVFKFLGA